MTHDDDAPAGPRAKTPFIPPVTHDHPVTANGSHLVDVAQLDGRGVVEVSTDHDGVLAVGMTPDGLPFAVSNVCRHQFAKLGRGRVTDDGCLECPWHRAEFDVTDGSMRSGPKGRLFGIGPYSAAIKALGNVMKLQNFPVEVREGAIWLVAG